LSLPDRDSIDLGVFGGSTEGAMDRRIPPEHLLDEVGPVKDPSANGERAPPRDSEPTMPLVIRLVVVLRDAGGERRAIGGELVEALVAQYRDADLRVLEDLLTVFEGRILLPSPWRGLQCSTAPDWPRPAGTSNSARAVGLFSRCN